MASNIRNLRGLILVLYKLRSVASRLALSLTDE